MCHLATQPLLRSMAIAVLRSKSLPKNSAMHSRIFRSKLPACSILENKYPQYNAQKRPQSCRGLRPFCGTSSLAQGCQIGLIPPFRKSISHTSFFAQKKPDRKQTSQSASCPAAISSNSSPSEQGILYHTRAGLSSMAFPPRGIRISDGRSCCDFRPRRQRYPLRSVHSDNPLCVITSSQYMRRSQRSSPLHDP